MIHLVALALAALHLNDPIGDAVGDGSLTPPTAPVYADLADFDLERVSLLEGDTLRVRVAMGQLGNPADLPNGFSSAVIEIYLDTAPGGSAALLPGSGMRMPSGRGWDVALRLTGDVAQRVQAEPQGDPATWPREPVAVQVDGNALVVDTGLPRPRDTQVYAIDGVYDPFAADGWRPLATSPSPWAFSSSSQRLPVVDVLANDATAQRRAIDSGELPSYRSRTQGVGWLLLMLLGVVLAGLGLMLRRRVPPPAVRTSAGRPRPGPAERTAAPEPGEVASAPPPDGTPGPADGGASPLEHVADTFLDEATEAALWPDADRAVVQAIEAAPSAAVGRGARPDPSVPEETVSSEPVLDEPVPAEPAPEAAATDIAKTDIAKTEVAKTEVAKTGTPEAKVAEAGPVEAEVDESGAARTEAEQAEVDRSGVAGPEAERAEVDGGRATGPEVPASDQARQRVPDAPDGSGRGDRRVGSAPAAERADPTGGEERRDSPAEAAAEEGDLSPADPGSRSEDRGSS